ncbi:MAG: ABC transporter substrate-binding protein [Bacteroidales bacterium]|nr:ABC transporter substrate-binding protein [Bacteroidales bacterium]
MSRHPFRLARPTRLVRLARRLAWGLLPLAALAAACHRTDPTEGKMIFRYNEPAGLATLDPAFAKDQALIWATSQLFNGLVRLDTALVPEPCLAHSWDVSPDGTCYTFHLRPDVRFHPSPLLGPDSTRVVVAADFVYSFGRILDPDVASPGRWIFADVAPDGFQAPDDSTFVVRLRRPFAPFLSLLAMPYCAVVPHEVVEHYGDDFRRHPCGTGPFRLQLWKEGVKLVLRRNERYFETDPDGRPLPRLDAVAVTFIVDKQTAFLEFVKGNLDFMNSLDAGYKDELLTRTGSLKPKYAERLVMQSCPFLNTEYLGFNMDDSLLADRRLRQAICCGFDRAKMMKYLRNGIGTPGEGGMVPLGLMGDATAYGYHYDPERARRLLAEAGHPDGQGLPPLQLATTASYLDLCRYIQQQLALLGLDVRLDVNPPAALREHIAQGQSPWFRGSWIADYPDAENYLSLFYSPNRAPQGPNYTHFTSPAFDRLYERSRNTTDPLERQRLYRAMDSLVMEEAPVVVLYYDQILHFTHPNVHHLRTNAMNALDLRYVTID